MTPTREQVIQLLIDADIIQGHPSNYTCEIDSAVVAYSAGRAQGLREAREVCEKEAIATFAAHHLYRDGSIHKLDQMSKSLGCDQCADAIKQLEGK